MKTPTEGVSIGKRTLGNVIRYPHQRDAERAANALRSAINSEFVVPETISELVTHYRKYVDNPEESLRHD